MWFVVLKRLEHNPWHDTFKPRYVIHFTEAMVHMISLAGSQRKNSQEEQVFVYFPRKTQLLKPKVTADFVETIVTHWNGCLCVAVTDIGAHFYILTLHQFFKHRQIAHINDYSSALNTVKGHTLTNCQDSVLWELSAAPTPMWFVSAMIHMVWMMCFEEAHQSANLKENSNRWYVPPCLQDKPKREKERGGS